MSGNPGATAPANTTKLTDWFARIKAQARFLFKAQRGVILICLLAALGGWALTKPQQVAAKEGFWSALEPLLGLVTLAVGFFIWLGENREDWEASLPKRLNVTFVFNGKAAIRAENAALVTEADIRALSQQIGQQLNNNKLLAFEPNVEVTAGQVIRRDGRWIKLYEARFRLTAPPKYIPQEKWPARKVFSQDRSGQPVAQ